MSDDRSLAGWARIIERSGHQPDKVSALKARVAELEAEVERLKREGTPGVMHEVDKAFYDLALKERDFYSELAGRRLAEIIALRVRNQRPVNP
jgi:hypothetical protein